MKSIEVSLFPRRTLSKYRAARQSLSTIITPCPPTTMSTTTSIHPASLVHSSKHSPLLIDFLSNRELRIMLDYLMDGAFELTANPTNPLHIPIPFTNTENVLLTDFATYIIDRAMVNMPILSTAFVYVSRAKHYFAEIHLEQCPRERMFLGALMLASKYLIDCPMKNVHWSWCSGVPLSSIDSIERAMLAALTYDLSVSEAELLNQRARIVAKTIPQPPSAHYIPSLYPSAGVLRLSVPALDSEPSSPSSSDGSPSPRTPLSPWPEVPSKRSSPFHKLAGAFRLPSRHQHTQRSHPRPHYVRVRT